MRINHKSDYRANTWVLLAMACASLAGLTVAQANAAERITLANGFDLVCNRHETIDGRVRAYLKAGGVDYVELSPEAIQGVETVPDPPAEIKPEETTGAAAAAPGTKNAQIRPVEARLTAADLHQLLARAGAQHNVDEDLLASVVKAESGGYVRATSRAGARGLMQLMPGTAQQLGVADSFAPDENVQGGTAYLDWLLTRYHDNIALALAAYNAGPEAVDRYRGIPPYRETRMYVARVVHEFNRRIAARSRNAGMRTASVTRSQATPNASKNSAEMGNE